MQIACKRLLQTTGSSLFFNANDLEELFYEFTAVNINGYYTGIDRVSAGQQFWSSCFVQKHF